jgi:DNA (cytosine-5)-methyltransferase 1
MKRTVAEFFAGIGLMRHGLEQGGWQVVWANDIDKDKEQIYKGHFSNDSARFVLGNIHEVDGASLPDVALATASFPCNDLSLAGGRRGLAGEQSGAFWGFVKVIKEMGLRRPALVLLENVPGFLTSHDGEDFRDACVSLNELGYSVDALTIDAAHFVPQSRQRLFVIGSRQAPAMRLQETPTFLESSCRPAALSDFILWHPEIRWCLRDLPQLPRKAHHIEEIIEDVSPNSSYWWSVKRAEYLLNQMSVRHRREAERMISGDKVAYGTVFRRVRKGRSMAELRTDGIAGCLRTPRGGSGRQILFVAGRGHYAVRLLTPKECARLMGVDDYVLASEVTLNQALFGFGDAVCVPVIRWIAVNYLNPLFDELYGAKEADNPKRSIHYASR